MSEVKSPNVFQRMHAVMSDLETISKNGKNSFHGYDYATEADFIRAVKPLLVKHGLVMFCVDQAVVQVTPLMKGTDEFSGNILTTVKSVYRIVNIDNPEDYTTVSVGGQGVDKGDKGIYKATTGAKKYAIANGFMIVTGDDPEKDGVKSKRRSGKLTSASEDF